MKMKFCEVISDFNINDFDILKQQIKLDNTIFFTNSLNIYEKIRQLGSSIQTINQYFREVGSKIFPLQRNAIKNMISIKNTLENIKYYNISVIDGLKLNILECLLFLEKINAILNGGKNVIFLFDNQTYYYFSIPIIADRNGYISKFGVAKIINSHLVHLDFQKTFVIEHRDIYEKSKKVLEGNQSEIIKITEGMRKKFESVPISQYAFFLITNEDDFYLKPVYPVINKFMETDMSFIIFTFSHTTSNQLERKKIRTYDLSSYIDPLETVMLQQEQKVFQDVFDKINELLVNNSTSKYKRLINDVKRFFHTDLVIESYLHCFKNDRIVRDMSRTLSTIIVIRQILEKFNFKSILVATDGDPSNDIVCSTARDFNIQTYTILPELNRFQPIFSVLYNASKLLVSGSRLKRGLEKIGINNNRIVVTGSPKYDYVKQAISTDSDQSDQTDNTNLIIVAMSRMHENDEGWMSDLIHFCNERGFDIIIKFHPTYKAVEEQKKIVDQKIKKIMERCKGLKFNLSFDVDLRSLFPRAKVFITEHSSTALEAILHDIPIITVSIGMKNENGMIQYHKEKVALHAKNTKELFKHIDSVMNDNIIKANLGKGRREFIFEFNYLNDGKAADRIFNILTNN